MARAKFYLGDIAEYFKDKETDSSTKFYRMELLEGDGYDGDYVKIDDIYPVLQQEYYVTQNASVSYVTKWYKFVFYGKAEDDQPDRKLGETQPVVPEDIGSIVDAVRQFLGDTNLDEPAWSDPEYISTIRFAVKQYKGDRNLSFIREEDIIPIQLLVRIEFAHILAYDHAKYYALQAPSATLDKSQIMSHYLQVAQAEEEHYNQIANRLGISNGGKNNDGIIHEMPAPNVGDLARFSATAGIKVSGIRPERYPRRNLLNDAPW